MPQHYDKLRVKLSSLLLFAIPSALFLALLSLPNAAFSQDTTPPSAPVLFAGNTGWDGHWLHVEGAATMGRRVLWNELNDEVSYQIQFATDASFDDIVLDVDGLAESWIEPDLSPGFYYFRIGATDFSGNLGPWSETGTLECIVDREAPIAAILSPTAGQVFSKGEALMIELEVSDDTVPRLAQFTINGEYAGSLGLMTQNYKIVPSFGTPRTVIFETEVPTKGGGSSLDIEVAVSDVVDNIIYVPEPGAFPAVFAGLGLLAVLGGRRASSAGVVTERAAANLEPPVNAPGKTRTRLEDECLATGVGSSAPGETGGRT